MKEEERLAAVVATIDQEVAVVPRGAYVKAPLGDVITNRSFKGMLNFQFRIAIEFEHSHLFCISGLSLEEAKRLNYYFHFRVPSVESSLADKTASVRNGTVYTHQLWQLIFSQSITKSIEFLDSILGDIPKGKHHAESNKPWNTQMQCNGPSKIKIVDELKPQ